jgi:hypothetical protein
MKICTLPHQDRAQLLELQIKIQHTVPYTHIIILTRTASNIASGAQRNAKPSHRGFNKDATNIIRRMIRM